MSDVMKTLIKDTGLSEFAIRKIVASAPRAYKEYFIQKRTGGYRRIAQPAKEVKVLQRSLVDGLLSNFPIHESAMAYRSGRNIRDNALVHAGSTQILKMDFKDFFPSIRDVDWKKFCNFNSLFENEEDLYITSQILFHKPKGASSLRLAIGAPSSPMLSNIMMFNFDKDVSSIVALENVSYTRYADDLTFSAPRTGYLNGVQKSVRKILRDLDHPRLRINNEKTVCITTKYSRNVTGLVLANDGRVTIGRDRKRTIRAAVHHFISGRNTDLDLSWLAGMISFIKSAEPEFFSVLVNKFGYDVIMRILREGSSHSK